MRRRLAERGRAGILLLACGLMPSVGCTHNYYYYTTPGAVGVPSGLAPCDPMPGTRVISSNRPILGTPVVGSVCDDPPQGSTVVGMTNSPISSNAGTPIGAEPIYSRPFGRPLRLGGLAWRSSNPEGLATRVEGNIPSDDDSARR